MILFLHTHRMHLSSMFSSFVGLILGSIRFWYSTGLLSWRQSRHLHLRLQSICTLIPVVALKSHQRSQTPQRDVPHDMGNHSPACCEKLAGKWAFRPSVRNSCRSGAPSGNARLQQTARSIAHAHKVLFKEGEELLGLLAQLLAFLLARLQAHEHAVALREALDRRALHLAQLRC